jgi:hypothetical protein
MENIHSSLPPDSAYIRLSHWLQYLPTFTTHPISHGHPDSSSKPTPRVGNLNGRRREIIPNPIGSSQPTPRLGNLSRRRRDVIPDSVGSNQTTSRAGILNGRRREVVLTDRVSRSRTRQIESGSANTAGSSGRNSSPPPIARQLLGQPGIAPPE